LSVTEHSDGVKGRNGYSSRDVDLLFGANVLPQIYGWLVGGCEAAFWVQEAKDMGQGRTEVGT